MSFTLTPGKPVKAKDVVAELEAAKAAQLEAQPFDSYDDDIDEAIAVGSSIAGEIAEQLGEDQVYVNISGHCRRGTTDPSNLVVNVSGLASPPK